MKKIYMIIGTRPDAIKMAPVYHALRQQPSLDVTLVSTGQHRELLASVLNSFAIKPDIDLGVMQRSQSLSGLTTNIMSGLEYVFRHEKPDLVLNHGDTATCYASSLSCFYQNIPFYHVEAGLRSYDIRSPYPEEFHRRAIAFMAAHHFVPTARERLNLMTEGIKESAITIAGNTIHESIRCVDYKNDANVQSFKHGKYTKIITVTMHRRDNLGTNLYLIMNAIKNIALRDKQCIFVFPVHPNPHVEKVSSEVLCGVENIMLVPPLDYHQFIALLNQSDLILTDSGGVQEEATYLEKTVFILRTHTERYDGIEQGFARIIGVNGEIIEREVTDYLQAGHINKTMANVVKNDAVSASNIIAEYIVRNVA